MIMKNVAKSDEELTCHFKTDTTEFLPEYSNVSKIYTYEEKLIGVMFDGTEDWCKMWKKTDLCFQKWHEDFGKFSQAEIYQFHFRK